MKKVGLFFGTFNPIHIGHLVIANYIAEFSDLAEVWLVITPKSPFKAKESLLDNNHRYQMVYEAVKNYPNLKPSKIEFELPRPNYTIRTLVHLEERYGSSIEFVLLMGEDNLKGLHKWKNHEQILQDHVIYCYPRVAMGEISTEYSNHPKIHRIDAPIMEISSTFIREKHRAGKDIRAMLPEAVWKYMDEMNFYR